MALRLNLWAGGTPVWSAAGSWATCDATGSLVSTNTGTTTLSAANQDSAVFAPGAVTVDGVALRLGSRAVGAPTNTITVTLRNSTDATDIASVTANVSDLPACSTTEDEGGWAFFKFSANYLLVAGKNYIIQVKLSATTTAVALRTNGTAANWQRLLRTTATGAPAAGDDMFICGQLDGSTNPATLTTTAITYDITAATDFGSAATSLLTPALSISFSAGLLWQETPATAYVLRLSGNLICFGGNLQIAPGLGAFPANSSVLIEFDCAADGDFGLTVKNGAALDVNGSPRTTGKNWVAAKLTADEAVAATTIDIDTDTGWLSGDEVAIAGTSTTTTQFERRTLNANAGAASFVITVGLTNAHTGTGDHIADVILLTRNVRIQSVSTTAVAYCRLGPTSNVTFRWVSFRYLGMTTAGKRGALEIETTASGYLLVDYSVVQDTDSDGIFITGAAHDGWVIRNTHFYNIARANILRSAVLVATTSGTAWSLTDIVVIGLASASCDGVNLDGPTLGTFGNLTVQGATQYGLRFGVTNGVTSGTQSGTLKLYGNTHGLHTGSFVQNLAFANVYCWRNTTTGVIVAGALYNTTFTTGWWGGNGTNLRVVGGSSTQDTILITLTAIDLGGETGFATGIGINFNNPNVNANVAWRLINCKLSQVTGTRVAHTTTDLNIGSGTAAGITHVDLFADNCLFGAATEVTFAGGAAPTAIVSSAAHDQTEGLHKTFRLTGTLTIETTTVDVSPSIKLTPTGGTTALQTGAGQPGFGFMVPVLDGAAVTVTVKVQKDASYNGATMPQLVVLENRQCGITADTVLDTHVAAAGAWETLSGVTAAVSADGVLEFVVRAYGTAGNAFVDTWTAA